MTTLSNLPQAPEAVDDVEGIVVNAPNAPNPSDVTHKGRLRSVATLLSRVFTYLTTTRLSDSRMPLAPGIARKVFADDRGRWTFTPVMWARLRLAPRWRMARSLGCVIQQSASISAGFDSWLTIVPADTTMGFGRIGYFTLPSPLDWAYAGGNRRSAAVPWAATRRFALGGSVHSASSPAKNQIECLTDDVADFLCLSTVAPYLG